jgi:hypothetical protein
MSTFRRVILLSYAALQSPTYYSVCRKYFPMAASFSSPEPHFKKWGDNTELLLKSSFEKGGFKNLHVERIYGKRSNNHVILNEAELLSESRRKEKRDASRRSE